MSIPVIDAHCHYGRGDGLSGPWDTRADITAYLRRARSAGIGRVALIPVLSRSYREGNQLIVSAVASRPEQFYAYVAVSPVGDRGAVDRIVGPLVRRHRNIFGIKVHHYNGAVTREICDVARRYSVPVLWDVGGDVGRVEVVAEEYPEVIVIVPHLGSYSDDWHAQKRCIDIMCRRANVYVDTSGVRRFDVLEEAVKRAGAQRVIFGSDGPYHHPAVEIEKIRQLSLSKAEKELILGGNFLRLAEMSRRRSLRRASAGLRR